MQASLSVRKGLRRGTLFPIYESAITLIGAAPSNHVVLPESGVSAYHCLIVPDPSVGGFMLIDARSKTGLYVKSRPFTKGPITFGDVISIGPFELEVVPADHGIARPAPPLSRGPSRFEFGRRRGKGLRLPSGSATVVGRGEHAHIRVDHHMVSEYHCIVALDPADNGSMPFLIDLHSANHTYVNQRPVHRKHVMPGDAIIIGRATFEVREVGPVRQPAPQPRPAPARVVRAPRPAAAEVATAPAQPRPAPAPPAEEPAHEDLEEIFESLAPMMEPVEPIEKTQADAAVQSPAEAEDVVPLPVPPPPASPVAEPSRAALDLGVAAQPEAVPAAQEAAEAPEAATVEEPSAPAESEPPPEPEMPAVEPPPPEPTEAEAGPETEAVLNEPLMPSEQAIPLLSPAEALRGRSATARVLAAKPGEFQRYFGFEEDPFEHSADPKYFYHSECHWEAFTALNRWIETGPPLAVLFGEHGSGKTFLISCLARRLALISPWTVVVRLDRETSKRDNLILAAVLSAAERYGQSWLKGRAPLEVWGALLAEVRRRHSLLIVLVDDAQDFAPEHLQTLAELLDDPTVRDGVRILLAGEEHLRDLVAVPPLSGHLGTTCYLSPMGVDDVAAYVNHRVLLASNEEKPLFTRRALEMIATYSGGIPRLINNVADAALFFAFCTNHREVTRDIVAQAINELIRGGPAPEPR